MFEKDSYTSMGARLKERRQHLNISRSDVASQLKIREHYIKAIEYGEIDKIPSGAYFHGYLKMYSNFLGIKPFDFRTLQKPVNENIPLKPQKFFSTSDLTPSKKVILLSLIMMSIIFALRYITY